MSHVHVVHLFCLVRQSSGASSREMVAMGQINVCSKAQSWQARVINLFFSGDGPHDKDEFSYTQMDITAVDRAASQGPQTTGTCQWRPTPTQVRCTMWSAVLVNQVKLPWDGGWQEISD